MTSISLPGNGGVLTLMAALLFRPGFVNCLDYSLKNKVFVTSKLFATLVVSIGICQAGIPRQCDPGGRLNT
jgi:hypothetical protein